MQLPEPIITRKKSRYARIRVTNEGGLELFIPLRMSEKEAYRILESKKDWIMKKLSHFDGIRKSLDIGDGKIHLLGEKYDYLYDPSAKKTRLDKSSMTIFSALDLKNKKILDEWQKKEAKKMMLPLVGEIAKKHDLKIGKVSIRGQKTRWGSCSGTNNISLNWRLLKCPLEVMGYVIYHELAHVKEKNHSASFWEVVEGYDPDYKAHRKWLKEKGNLMLL